MPCAKPLSVAGPVPVCGTMRRKPPRLRSRLHGRPPERYSSMEVTWYSSDTQTSTQVGVHQRREREVDQPVDAAVRQRGLGTLAGEHVHPPALTARLDQGQDLTSSCHRALLVPGSAGGSPRVSCAHLRTRAGGAGTAA